jgi:hypothetical protein
MRPILEEDPEGVVTGVWSVVETLADLKYLVPSVRVKWKRLGEPLHARTCICRLHHVYPDPTLPCVIRPDTPPHI